MTTPVNNKRKVEDMSDIPAATPSKRRVTAKPKKRISIPGAFPITEPSSQETSQRSAHSVVSARNATPQNLRGSLVPHIHEAHRKSTASPIRKDKHKSTVQKHLASRRESAHKKHTNDKKHLKEHLHANHQPQRRDVSLRFSFSACPRDTQGPLKKGRRRGRATNVDSTKQLSSSLPPIISPTKPAVPGKEDKVLNRSFSELLLTTTHNNLTGPLRQDYSETPSDLSSDPIHEPKAPDPSVFSHPSKKKEGYGFSYSEPLWYDSDEYPDTECEWDPDDEEQTVSGDKFMTIIDQDSSFDDIVVMRDIGSFHVAKPQRILACTQATREDTLRLKHRAKTLFKWDESGDVYAGLVGRVERMVYNDLEKRISGREVSTPSVMQCASKLRDFLQRTQEERIETGESRRAVEHEVEWASWLVEASRTGVMHLKTKGCSCRPDWEED